MPPLPQNGYTINTQIYAAYEMCLWLEGQIAWNVYPDELQKGAYEHNMLDVSPVVAARVLGFGLLYAPNDAGRGALVHDINACDMNQELLAGLAHIYVDGFIRVFYSPTDPILDTITSSLSPQLSLEEAVCDLHLLKPSDGNAYRLRQLALIRDDHRCVFSGFINLPWAERHLYYINQSEPFAQTNTVHIINQCLSDSCTGTTQAVRDKFFWTKSAEAVIDHFGGFSAHDVLGDEYLHSPKNAFTASCTTDTVFHNLGMWLTPAKDEKGEVISDAYDVHHYLGWEFLGRLWTPVKERVQFRNFVDGDKDIPAPDPTEYLSEVYMNMDDLYTL